MKKILMLLPMMVMVATTGKTAAKPATKAPAKKEAATEEYALEAYSVKKKAVVPIVEGTATLKPNGRGSFMLRGTDGSDEAGDSVCSIVGAAKAQYFLDNGLATEEAAEKKAPAKKAVAAKK